MLIFTETTSVDNEEKRRKSRDKAGSKEGERTKVG